MEKQDTGPVKTSKEENGAENLTAANFNEESNDADYLKKMVDDNPNNHLFLKKYAQFLFQVRNFFMFKAHTHLLGMYNVSLIQHQSKLQPLSIICTDDTKSKL